MTDTDYVDNRRRQEVIEAMRNAAVSLPEGYKFDRDETYDDRFDSTVLGRALKESARETISLGGDALSLNEGDDR